MAFILKNVSDWLIEQAEPFSAYTGHDKKSHGPRLAEILLAHLPQISRLYAEQKIRKAAYDAVNKTILCHHRLLGTHIFECPCCHRVTELHCTCHGRLCPSCGAKTQRIIAASASATCVDWPHRHIVFTIPQEYRILSRNDRSLLDLLYVAARNTIFIIANPKKYNKLLKKARKAGKSVCEANGGIYLFNGDKDMLVPGMIACLHTFGRDLKWNPHIHAVVAEETWDQANGTHGNFHHINFNMLRYQWQRQLNELLLHRLGPIAVTSDGEVIARFGKDNPTYKKYSNGYYVRAAYDPDIEPEDTGAKEEKGRDGKNGEGDESAARCIQYIIR